MAQDTINLSMQTANTLLCWEDGKKIKLSQKLKGWEFRNSWSTEA